MVKYEVVMATSMKMAAFWDVGTYSLVDIDRRFRGAHCLHHKLDWVPVVETGKKCRSKGRSKNGVKEDLELGDFKTEIGMAEQLGN
jgi:hypothetical protein